MYYRMSLQGLPSLSQIWHSEWDHMKSLIEGHSASSDKLSSCAMRLVAQSCPTLCDPKDCGLPGSSVHGDSPDRNTAMGCHFLLQGIFPTQGSNLGHLHCRQILYQQSHWGSPQIVIIKHQILSIQFINKPILRTHYMWIILLSSMATHSSFLAWRILQREEPGR